jgi:hypothetical protein
MSNEETSPKSINDIPIGTNYQIPNTSLDSAFGKLTALRQNDRIDVVLTVLMEPVPPEGARTGVALDGSISMQAAYGQIHEPDPDRFTAEAFEELKKNGHAVSKTEDNQELIHFTDEGWDKAIEIGLYRKTQNVVQPFARECVPYLADQIDSTGGTTVIYWACGEQGDEVEIVGDLTAEKAKSADYEGPEKWGCDTHLLPAMKGFVEMCPDAKWGMYIFVTDGRLADLEAVKQYTADLARAIADKKQNEVKCVLIGVGLEVDQGQMEELDDLPDAIGLTVDIWDHRIAAEMREVKDLFAEVVDENTKVADSGRILDHNDNEVMKYSDMVPQLMKFSLPLDASKFTLIVGNTEITQNLFPAG